MSLTGAVSRNTIWSPQAPMMANAMSYVRPRQPELDFIKGVMIVLVVVFHLGYIGDLYPTAKAFVYTFHMPTFLLLSGYLLNTQRPAAAFGRKLLWIFVPYAVMESAYVVASAIMPVRERVDNLSLLLLVDKNLLHPLGPYWYLHTLMLCSLTCYVAERLPRRGPGFSAGGRLVVAGLLLWELSRLGLVNAANAFWFLGGAVVRMGGLRLSDTFFPAWLAIVPVALMATEPAFFDRATLPGVVLTLCVLSFLTALWRRWGSRAPWRGVSYLGRNTLVVFLFSPIFTMAMKQLLPLFRFDATGLAYLVCATAVAVAGSLGVAAAMDRTGLSRYLFGRQRVLNG